MEVAQVYQSDAAMGTSCGVTSALAIVTVSSFSMILVIRARSLSVAFLRNPVSGSSTWVAMVMAARDGGIFDGSGPGVPV